MSYRIPLFELNYSEKEERAALKTIRSRWISMGPKTKELEAEFSRQLDVPYSVALTNCTAALHLALMILDVREGDEVIVPSLTFVATANAVRYVGATPVFADVKGPKNLTIDPDHVERLITKRTKAILVMHYGGFACDMTRIGAIARKHGLKIVEDACHAPLSDYKGKKLGTIGDIGCFSFFSNKNISTAEGGILVTRNKEYFEKAVLLRSHGMTTLSYERSKGHSVSYDVVALGFNYRIDDIRASLGLVQLKRLKPDLIKRAEVRAQYLKGLKGADEVIVPFEADSSFVSNYIFPVVLRDSTEKRRSLVRDELHRQGIQTSVHYPAAHRFSIYKKHASSLPQTEYASDNELTLPMYASLGKKDIKTICEALKTAARLKA